MSSYKCFEKKKFKLKPANFSIMFPGIETKLPMSCITLTLNHAKEKYMIIPILRIVKLITTKFNKTRWNARHWD